MRRWVYRRCLSVRPTQLGALLKVLLGIRRRYVPTADGATLWVDPASQLGYEVLATGRYEPSMEGIVRALVRPGDVFVDVGANEGYFCVLAAGIHPDVVVIAVEPQSRLGPVLLRNVEINHAHNVTVRPVALDRVDGSLRLYLRPSTNCGASGPYKRRLGHASEEAVTRTLDNVLRDHALKRVRLLKIDCEGAEDRVLDGAANALAGGGVDFIALEYHPTLGADGEARSIALHHRLLDAGYVLTVANGNHVYHHPGDEDELAALTPLRTGGTPQL
ncbi:MAG: FkbM family methyltransferase [Acidimicrobiales bacterium]